MRNLISYLNLPIINNLDELSYFLTYTKEQLNSFMFNKASHYVTFKIPKKNSIEKRTINAPKKCLKMAQKIILVEILEKIPCSEEATAFKKGQNGILQNALVHTENIFLLKMDFKDFFQSIKIECIQQIFSQLGYNEAVSKNLASLCTFKNQLPQGGICSPYLSNLACYNLDAEITKYCNAHNIAYTRYADDLLFSSNDINLLKILKNEISTIVDNNRDQGFQIYINPIKTKLITKNAHKKITGITINDNLIKVSKNIKNKIRQELYFLFKNNISISNSLKGNIAYALSIENKDFAKYLKKYVSNLSLKFNRQNSDIEQYILKTLKKHEGKFDTF